MCGRFSLMAPASAIADAFNVVGIPEFEPRYNIAPTQQTLVLNAPDGHVQAELMRWGLIPFWADDPKIGSKLINARSETASKKTSFRTALTHRRCLVITDGFYEWQRVDGKKQPWRIVSHNAGPFAMAGLWERWFDVDGQQIRSFTVLTTSANAFVAPVHARMPVILSPEDHAQWLDPTVRDKAVINALMVPCHPGRLARYRVSTHVNSVRNQDARCAAPLPDESWLMGQDWEPPDA
ncbi:MAG: putative SOS response-associated peptidase YedK [Kiritimatiellia bacterium]|jgi:putative SOS response-associated peptidase YedK